MTETKWESWEGLNNLPDDKKKDLILWMLTTQDELVNAVEQEHQQEIQMKKLMNENEELRKTLKNERSKATRAQNKLTKQIEELSGNPGAKVVDLMKSNDSTPVPIAEAAPQAPAPERKKRKARTVKTTPADLPAAAPAADDEDQRTLDQVPVNEQQPVRAGAAKMQMLQLQRAVNAPDLTPWHRQIAEQEIQRREQTEEIEQTPGTTAPAPTPTNGTAPIVGIKERVLSMMKPGAKHSFNDLMAVASQNGIAEGDFIGAITELNNEGTVDFPEAEMVTRLQ